MKEKAKEYLFVDGYNIINSWEDLRKQAEISLEEARYDLLEILSEYHHFSGIEIMVVFDAHYVVGNMGNVEDYKGIRVVFTRENETADHYIERTLNDVGRIKKIRVATSDWMEQQMVLSRGGTRISARELEMEIQDQYRMIKRRRKINNGENNLKLGNLDEKTLRKLKGWNK